MHPLHMYMIAAALLVQSISTVYNVHTCACKAHLVMMESVVTVVLEGVVVACHHIELEVVTWSIT